MRRSCYVNYYVLCLVCWILLGITGVSTRSHSLVKRYDGIYMGPYFDSNTPTNITAQLGSHAYLPCKVRQLGNKSAIVRLKVEQRDVHEHHARHTFAFQEMKGHRSVLDLCTVVRDHFEIRERTYKACSVRHKDEKVWQEHDDTGTVLVQVSWVRRRDSHILSVDRTMFIPDERFQALFVDASDTWTLQVKYVQARDEGEYECQISTDPKKSHIIKLNIVVPKIEIIGDRDMYVKTGSTVAIRCVIKQSLEGPFYVFWYHEGNRVLDYQLNKIDIQTEKIDHDTVSSLVIHKARREDSGNYTCSPSSLDSASVQLHVLNGEHPAAIQRGISSAPGGCPTLWWLAGVVTLYSSHGSRLFVLALLILMVLYSKNPSYFAPER